MFTLFGFLSVLVIMGISVLIKKFGYDILLDKAIKLAKTQKGERFKMFSHIVFCIVEFFKALSLALIVITVTDLLCNAIVHKGILEIYNEISNPGIQFLLIVAVILFLFWIVYKKRRLYQNIRSHYAISRLNEDEMKQEVIYLKFEQQKTNRKLSIVLKFAPIALITVFIENIIGSLKNNELSIIDYIMTNQANIVMVAIFLVYIFWVYDINRYMHQIEDSLKYIECKLYKLQRDKTEISLKKS